MDIHELFEAAGNLHGHLCPGLAIGVRAAAEAGGLLHGELRCAIESRACWADGFQSVLGATVGNGRLCLRETGKPVFNFYGAGSELRPGRLADIAPTILDVMGLACPPEMDGETLIVK